MPSNTGFLEPKIESNHYLMGGLGGVPKLTLRPNRDWLIDFGNKEEQFNKKYDTSDCTAFGTIKSIQRLEYEQTGKFTNYSERWLGTMAGTTAFGNDPHTVSEAIRKYGLVPEEMMPFDPDLNSVDEYYSFKGVDKDACIKAGEEWKKKWDFMHEWVYDWTQVIPLEKRQDLMMEALTMCPPGIAVSAWNYNSESKTYTDEGKKNNHWTNQVGVEPKKYWQVNDSYLSDGSLYKNVDWMHNITFVKRYYMVPKVFTPEIGNWIQRLLDDLRARIKSLISVKPVPVSPVVPPIVKPVPAQLSTAEIKALITEIANAMGVSPKLALAVCQCESSFKPTAVLYNKKADGTVSSVDRGLYQWNSKYHPQITDEMAFDPKTATRLFCQAIKDGKLDAYWSASKPCWSKLL